MYKNILVTGGLGFIGSHTVVELVNNNNFVYIIDNLCNSKIETLEKIKLLCDPNKILFFNIDLLDEMVLKLFFEGNKIDGIIHFAAFKAVNESIEKPIEYYNNNIVSTLNLLKMCKKFNINKFIFSSSATVYGKSQSPLVESDQVGLGITNPYGQTKFMIERILNDVSKIGLKVINLRYFNPVGAHKSGLLGEDPNGIPNNLMPYILRVAIKNNCNNSLPDVYKKLSIFGNTYNTSDGTCERDFIHVVDLAVAHVKAYEYICKMKEDNNVFNIGTGEATSVLELVDSFKKYNNINLPYEIKNKREGDIDVTFCKPTKANNVLNWTSLYNIKDIVIDSWNYAKKSL